MLCYFFGDVWGLSTHEICTPLINGLKIMSGNSVGTHDRGKRWEEGLMKVIKGRKLASFGMLVLSILSQFLDLINQVTCCLAWDFRVENSPILRGTSSATLHWFFHYHLREFHRFIFYICIHLCQQCIFLEDAMVFHVRLLQLLSRGWLAGEYLEEKAHYLSKLLGEFWRMRLTAHFKSSMAFTGPT